MSDAAHFRRNVTFTEFTARKLSNARFRGIGSSPNNPAHHLHRRRAAAERQLVEHRAARRRADRVRARPAERAVRPQHARRADQRRERAAVASPSGPAACRCRSATSRLGGARQRVRGARRRQAQRRRRRLVATASRDGFTDQRRHRQRHRLARGVLGKGQLLWMPATNWEARVIVSGERARDGDYALNDLAALRANPFHSPRATSRASPIATSSARRCSPRGRRSVRSLDHDRVRELEDARTRPTSITRRCRS